MGQVDLPNFAYADDATVQASLPFIDGRWSAQTQDLLTKYCTTRLELNANWAATPTDWLCPVCQRRKPQIARVTPAGVLLCELVWHHDHLGDEGEDILRRGQVKHPERAQQEATASAVRACRALCERFHPILVCGECNTADAAAKATLGPAAPSCFSFAPSEIARLIRVAPARAHVVDPDVASAIWTAVAEDVADRLSFMATMAGRVAQGRHAREGSSYRPHPLTAIVSSLLDAADAPWRSEGLIEAVYSRSIQRDGFGSSAKPPSRQPTAIPTLADLDQFTASLRPNNDWFGPPEDWRCETCERSRFEMLRKAAKSGLWTAGAHRRRVFSVEDRSDALWHRNGWYEDALTYGDHHWVWVCKDCRQIVTDTKQTGQNLIDDCLSVHDIRNLLTSVAPHERPPFDRAAAARRARSNYEMMAAVENYDSHRRRCLNLIYGRRQLLRSHRETDVDALQLAEIWEDHIDPAHRPEHLAWLLAEGRRHAAANAHNQWPPAATQA